MSAALPPWSLDGYAALGLTGNPFVIEESPGVPAELWLDRADVPAAPRAGQRILVQVLGEKGAGKTSLLTHWRHSAPGPYHYVPPAGAGRWAAPPVADLA